MLRAASQPKISGMRSATDPIAAMVTDAEMPAYGWAARCVICGALSTGIHSERSGNWPPGQRFPDMSAAAYREDSRPGELSGRTRLSAPEGRSR
jgi:hypothetical protein